ncbi:cystathionine gamma-synthase [bacterium SCN 62-11]|nr:PLP-dependent transferase [Candidatus Eremiobacteraeota bacterium]ODT56290.1 MAG: cystathionine gamma-synthase [bacterium SCN 62-11]
MSEELRVESWLVSAGRPEGCGSPLNTPLVPASNFLLGSERGYARDNGTPTWEALEEILGGLEQGRSVAFSSGMAAISAVFDQLSAGARVVLPEDCYQGVSGLVAAGARKNGWSVRRLAVEDTAAWVEAAAESDLLWLESPSNPLLIVAELDVICAAPRKTGAILAVDNTFATPLHQQPLELGATFSIQSATKFIGGHSDLLAGVATTREEQRWQALRVSRELHGATPGTLEAFLAVRGVRTLALRLQRAQQNAMELAERLSRHTAVACVRYPGLAAHPTHAAARRLLKGFGPVISFDVRGDADAACRRIRLIRHATSLGGVESTMERRAAVPGQGHLPAGLIRLSVGIEDVEDLWKDLCQALA